MSVRIAEVQFTATISWIPENGGKVISSMRKGIGREYQLEKMPVKIQHAEEVGSKLIKLLQRKYL